MVQDRSVNPGQDEQTAQEETIGFAFGSSLLAIRRAFINYLSLAWNKRTDSPLE